MLRIPWDVLVGIAGTCVIIALIVLYSHRVGVFAQAPASAPGSSSFVAVASQMPVEMSGLPQKRTPEEPTDAAPGSPRDRELIALVSDASIVSSGHEQYLAYCAACHGEGDVGGESPSNLFDGLWYRGGTPAEIEKTILDGYVPAGMPSWREMLPQESIEAVTAYLLSRQPGVSGGEDSPAPESASSGSTDTKTGDLTETLKMEPTVPKSAHANVLDTDLSAVPVALSSSSSERDRELFLLASDPLFVAQGDENYAAYCAACHGEGNVGGDSPSNLFDHYWYRGGSPEGIERTILDGYIQAGMPPWREMLPAESIAAVTAFIISKQS